VRYRLLGPLEVLGDDGGVVALPGERERALLATLVLGANRVVSISRLIEALWGEGPPATAENTLQVHVSKLRRKLAEAANGREVIASAPRGYLVRTEVGEVDLACFKELVEDRNGGPQEMSERLGEALALWRGPALADVGSDLLEGEKARLEELRLVATEGRIEADLTLGRHGRLVAELEALVRAQPLRERVRAQLMLALYRCGRQADALAAYQEGRHLLAEELGIDPGPELQALELAILNQSPELGHREGRSNAAALPAPAPDEQPRSTPVQMLAFLFTDIEGSTRLLRQVGDEVYVGLLAEHREVIRAAVAGHGGKEVIAEGDGLFFVFSSPRACVAAAAAAQRALCAHPWPKGGEVRVRMGVHVGEASAPASVGLVGLEVHRAARVAAVAYGGQVVLSAAAGAIVADSLPDGASLRDLGRHRLKDLAHPEQISQLVADGLPLDFPPLRSLDNPELANNLPSYLSSFVGRQVEVAEVQALVRSERLVTVVGAGGSGKTRLALQVAAELADGSGEGVWFADLSTLTGPEQVAPAVLSWLGGGPEPGTSPLERLVELLSTLRVLLVLDNCEHLISAAAKLADGVSRSCPSAHLLATSREPLGIDGEQVYRLRPLSLPPEDASSAEELASSEAAQLFVERARASDRTFLLDGSVAAPVASICRRLDGIPLAIELAAARVSTMSLVDLDQRLEQRFRVLTAGSRTALARQQTLQATVDWSYDLLGPAEQQVLGRLSVFAGGFDLAAAEAICGPVLEPVFEVAEVLGSLVNKSLVVAERLSGSFRYRLLETIRQYGTDKLNQTGGEVAVAEVRSAHAQYYLSLCEQAAPALLGREQGVWLKRLDPDWDNLRAALGHLSSEGAVEAVLRFGVAAGRFFATRGYSEPLEPLLAAAERADEVGEELRGRGLLATAALLGFLRGVHSQAANHVATELVGRAVQIARSAHNQRLLAESLAKQCSVQAFAGESRRATAAGNEALRIARHLGDPRLLGDVLFSLALSHAVSSPETEGELLIEAANEHRRAGDSFMLCMDLFNHASTQWDTGDVPGTRTLIEEAIVLLEEIGFSRVLTHSWALLGNILLRDGEMEKAVPLCRKALLAGRRCDPRAVAVAVSSLASCFAAAGDRRRAAQLSGAYESLNAHLAASAPPLGHRSLQWQLDIWDNHLARLRDALGEVELQRCLDKGRRMSLEAACDLALGRTDPD